MKCGNCRYCQDKNIQYGLYKCAILNETHRTGQDCVLIKQNIKEVNGRKIKVTEITVEWL